MWSGGTHYFMLGDHLGSTSLTTFANGNAVSEVRYKAWGEVRYSSGAIPTNYTFTGQYSYQSSFGLTFFNARWLDPSLGRFAQADSIVPGGVQGLDRYAYANNSPVIFVDPSGHLACIDGEYCRRPQKTDVPLTQPSSTLGKSGVEMKELFSFMHEKRGYNAYEFLAWILAIESSGDTKLFDILIDIASRRLWGDHENAFGAIDVSAACPTSTCFNGIFNYLGSYSQSAWGRYRNYKSGDYSALLQDPTNLTK